MRLDRALCLCLTVCSPAAWIPLGTDPAPALTITLRVPDDITAIEIQGHNATGRHPAAVQVSYYNATSPGVLIPGPTLVPASLSYENGDHAVQRFSVFLPGAIGVVLAVESTAALRVELYAHCLFFEPFDTYEKFTGLTAGGTAARLAGVPLRMFVADLDNEIFDGETISCASCFAMVNAGVVCAAPAAARSLLAAAPCLPLATSASAKEPFSAAGAPAAPGSGARAPLARSPP